MNIKYNEEKAIIAIKNTNNKSIRAIIREMGLNEESSGYYKAIYKTINKHNLDVSHLLGQSCNKNKKFGFKRPIEDYLTNKIYINSHALKSRLFFEGIKKEECESCKNTTWLNQKIPLELHHINGINSDNSIENLQILCPNCHAFTPNFCSKNSKTKTINRVKLSEEEIIDIIKNSYSFSEVFKKLSISSAAANYQKIRKIKDQYGIEFLRKNENILIVDTKENWRKRPRFHTRKVIRPSEKELIDLIKIKSMREIGKIYNVNGNAIRKWCVYYKIDYATISPFSLKYKKANPKSTK